MRIGVFFVALGVLLMAASALAWGTQGRARAAELEIEADNYYFCEASFQGGVCEKTVNLGDTVTWKIEDGVHTVTQCNDTFSTCPSAGGFDSGNLSQGQEFSHTFTAAGTFAFHCNNHPDQMRGRITVVAPATATPTPSPTQAAASPSPTSTPTPARAPVSGGSPGNGQAGPLWWILLAAGGALLLTAGTALAFRAVRRP